MKILIFALAANVAAASACAAMVRASGHKARAVDATLLTKADREAADLVVTHTEAQEFVQKAYDDGKVIVVDEFNPIHFVPDAMKAAEAWVRGESDEQPDFGAAPAGAKKADTNGDGALSVAEIKTALTAKGVAIPAGAKKADLLALLEAQL